jgi:hypothetical protein
MTWYYKNEIFAPSEETLSEYVGFVYLVTERDTNMKYVGKKLFHRRKTLPITKTRKRRKKVLVESDWRTYYGSNEKIQSLVEERGGEAFDREILYLCQSKGDCSYLEAKEQFNRDVLLRDDYYNGIINCKISSKHLKITK